MKKYYVSINAESNGEHCVHDQDCLNLPEIFNRIYLGRFDISFEAIDEAKKHFRRINGCKLCTAECCVSYSIV